MILKTGQKLNPQSFTPLPLPQDVINSMHRIARRNPKGLDIWDKDWRLFLEPEDRTNNDKNDSTYVPSDNKNSNNEDESGDNNNDHDDKGNLNPPPDQEMEQGATGVTINENVGVHQNENAGVH